MSDAVLITFITAVGGLMTAVLVELIRARRAQSKIATQTATVVTEVTPNSGASMKDALGRIETDIREIRTDQHRHGARLAAVEARMSDHLNHQRRGTT